MEESKQIRKKNSARHHTRIIRFGFSLIVNRNIIVFIILFIYQLVLQLVNYYVYEQVYASTEHLSAEARLQSAGQAMSGTDGSHNSREYRQQKGVG